MKMMRESAWSLAGGVQGICKDFWDARTASTDLYCYGPLNVKICCLGV